MATRTFLSDAMWRDSVEGESNCSQDYGSGWKRATRKKRSLQSRCERVWYNVKTGSRSVSCRCSITSILH